MFPTDRMIQVKTMHKLSFMLTVLLLVSCTDPRQSCIAAAVKELRTIQGLISETQANLARGYAVKTDTDLIIYTDFCPETQITDDPVLFCDRTATTTIERPIAIDLASQRRQLVSLEKTEARLLRITEQELRQCQRDFPA